MQREHKPRRPSRVMVRHRGHGVKGRWSVRSLTHPGQAAQHVKRLSNTAHGLTERQSHVRGDIWAEPIATCQVGCASSPTWHTPLILLVFIIEDMVLLVLVRILNGVVQGKDVVLLVVLPFIEAFQRRFEGLRVLLNILNVLK